ncbi:MAG: T9SS type A sorting domain-containing protein, partial [Calditrichaeota bacterium]|nr:T9SS type A sorting domain-containing protein [Calditrichota bacterium]
GVRRRNNDDNEGTNICRIDAFRIVVTTSAVPVCDFDTEPFDFDEVDVMDEDDWDFTIWNEGGVPLTGTIQLNGGSGMFSCPLDGHSYTIDPEDWLDVNVVFHPTEVGEFSCTLDAGIECGSVVVSGTGTMEPGICDFDTEPYEFFETELSNCDEDEFTIWNEGAGTLTGVIAFEDPDGAFHCDLAGQPYSIGAFEYLDVVVSFCPTAEGPFTAILDPGGDCGSIQLHGIGVNPNFEYAEDVVIGDNVDGDSEDSEGAFLGEGDYGCEGAGGAGPEVIYHLEHAGGPLGLTLQSEQLTELSLVLLAERDPQSCAAVAQQVGDRLQLAMDDLDAGAYYIVVDGSVENYSFTLSVDSQVSVDERDVPRDFTLLGNAPNPFNPSTRIRWTQSRAGDVELRVYNLAGEEVQRFDCGVLPAGENGRVWEAGPFASGTYIFQLRFEDRVETTKGLLIK